MDEHAPDRRGRARGKRAGPAPALPLVAGLTPSAPAEHHPQHHPPAPPPSSAKWLISESKTTTSQSSMGHVAHGQLRRARWGMGRRSEEHTSELQSRGHLVCRLLLEKKKQKKWNRTRQTEEASASCTDAITY